MSDLWPPDLGAGVAALNPPVAILREQAELLGKRTEGRLLGLVQSRRREQTFIHEFFVEAPTLDNYSYRLLTVGHPIEYYPLQFAFDVTGQSSQCTNEDEFISALRGALNSERTMKIIDAILAQVGMEGHRDRAVQALA